MRIYATNFRSELWGPSPLPMLREPLHPNRYFLSVKLTLHSLLTSKLPPLGLPEAGAAEVRRSLTQLALQGLL